MNIKLPTLIAAALIFGSASLASAAGNGDTAQGGVYATPGAVSYGGYSSDPHTRAIERLADKYHGWSEYIQ